MPGAARLWRVLVELIVLLLVARGRRAEAKGDLRELWHARHQSGRQDLWRATVRDVWGFRGIGPARRLQKGASGMWQDVWYAVRSWRRRPVAAVATALTLALGIGSASAIFAAVDAVLLRPLSFPNPERLVEVTTTAYRIGPVPRMSSGFLALPEIAAAGLWQPGGLNLEMGTDSERLTAAMVDDGFFTALGVQPALGDPLPAPDGVARYAVISSRLWRGRLSGERTIIGSPVTLNGRPFIVTGVMPPGFQFPESTDVWVPMGADFQITGGIFAPRVIARLAPGVGLAQADAAIWAWDGSSRPPAAGPRPAGPREAAVEPLGALLVRAQRPTMVLLGVSVAVLLLVVCASVANIMLARVSARAREFTVRRALGASRWRWLRQTAMESAVMVALGTGAGLLLSFWGLTILRLYAPSIVGPLGLASIDMRLLGIVLGVAAFTVIATSIAPGLVVGEGGATQAGRTAHDFRPRRSHRWRSALVVTQMALALVALCASGAAVTALRRVSAIDLGFGGTQAVAAQVVLPRARYATSEAIVSYLDRAVTTIEGLPGVRRAAVTGPLPGNREVGMAWRVTLAGASENHSEEALAPSVLIASPHYFTVMGVRRIAGREFAPADRQGSPPVVIVSRSLARRLTGSEASAVGRVVEMPLHGDADRFEVVGVVADVMMRGPNTEGEGIEQVYLPAAQVQPEGTVSFVAEVDGDASASLSSIADALTQVDPGVPAHGLQTIDSIADRYLASHRLAGGLVSAFALTTLVVAAVGLYGVMAQVVIERQREIGIRLALGAAYRDVRRRLLGRGLWLTVAGAVVGVAAAVAALRALAAIVPALEHVSVSTFIVSTALLMATGLIAVWFPAARVLSIDPASILRDEG